VFANPTAFLRETVARFEHDAADPLHDAMQNRRLTGRRIKMPELI
jgi:hypothetical protein